MLSGRTVKQRRKEQGAGGEGGTVLICGQASLAAKLSTEQGTEGGERRSHESTSVKNNHKVPELEVPQAESGSNEAREPRGQKRPDA